MLKGFFKKKICTDRSKEAQQPSNCSEKLEREAWEAHYNKGRYAEFVSRLSSGGVSSWSKEMINLTKPGSTVLEIGCGSGESSLWLAMQGRVVTASDYNKTSLDLVSDLAKEFNCEVQTIEMDAERRLPFEDNAFDYVFQAGLLEHYRKKERVRLLKEWARVCRGNIISMIPNAASLAYRVGKALMEQNGTWTYGLELPQYTLAQDFRDAGIKLTKEYTLGAADSLVFLPGDHFLRPAIEQWIESNTCGDNCGQGYLLVSIGHKEDADV